MIRYNIGKFIKVLAVIVVGVFLSELLIREKNMLVIGMELVGGGSLLYTLICILKDRKDAESTIKHTQAEYKMMILISGVSFLLASVMKYKTVFDVVPMFWIVVIAAAFIGLWRGAV